MAIKRKIFIFFLIISAVLRYVPLFTEYWLDEIWSIDHVLKLNSFQEIFTNLYTDNNHLLNSLYIYFCKDNYLSYRFLSFIFGVLSLYAVFLIEKEKTLFQLFSSLTLFSFSYMLILYSSEARGYSGVVCACLFSWYFLNNKNLKYASLLFSISCCIGMLSHLSFIFFLIAALIYEILRKVNLEIIIKFFAPSVFFFALFYFIFYKNLPPGSGTLAPYWAVIADTFSLILGGSTLSNISILTTNSVIICSFFVIFVFVNEVFQQQKIKDPQRLFFILIILVIPLLVLVITRPRVLFPRYFLVPITFYYFLLSAFLTRVYQRNLMGRFISICSLVVFVCLNILLYSDLVNYGRGEIRKVISYINEHEADPVISISGSNDTRVLNALNFYRENFQRKFDYGTNPEARWFIDYSINKYEIPEQEISRASQKYSLKLSTNSANQSGFRWFLYERL